MVRRKCLSFFGVADLQDAVGQKFCGVGIVVDDIIQRGVDIGNVEAFEIIVDVEGPVGADGVFAMTGRVGLELGDGEEAEAVDHGLEEFFERGGGI